MGVGDVGAIVPVYAGPVSLDPAGHTYSVGEGMEEGEAVSFSRMVEAVGLGPDFSRIKPGVLANASAVGTFTHAVANAMLMDYDPEGCEYEVDPFVIAQAQPCIRAFADYLKGHSMVPAYAEVPTYNPTLGYACTADFVGWYDGLYAVIDIKTSSSIKKITALQTIGQRECFRFRYGHGGWIPVNDEEPVKILRGALHLPKTGKPAKMHWFIHDERDRALLEAVSKTYHAKGVYL